MEDWAEIRRLHRAEGMPVRAIARKLGLGRNGASGAGGGGSAEVRAAAEGFRGGCG